MGTKRKETRGKVLSKSEPTLERKLGKIGFELFDLSNRLDKLQDQLLTIVVDLVNDKKGR